MRRESVLVYTLHAIFGVYTMIAIYQIHHNTIDTVMQFFTITHYSKYQDLQIQLRECQEYNQNLMQICQAQIEEIKEIANRTEIMKWIYLPCLQELSVDDVIQGIMICFFMSLMFCLTICF